MGWFFSCTDIVDKWEDLHTKATVRQQQSRELTSMYKDLSAVSTGLQDVVDELDLMTSFEDVQDLEYCIKELQVQPRIFVGLGWRIIISDIILSILK